jgi:hypothetical protein
VARKILLYSIRGLYDLADMARSKGDQGTVDGSPVD